MQDDSIKTKVHFIGINGSGISGVACIAKQRGFEVDGCDLKTEINNYTQQLLDNNINISNGHNVEHLKDIDIVVLSPALLYKDKYKQIEETNVAMETKKTIKWQQFLGEYIMKDKNVVAVAGTHGKTTTTSLVALFLEKANFDPTVFVGGIVKEWGTTYRVGNSDYYICEGDEYDGNFLYYNPKYIILNNLEMEHPERFKNIEDYTNNFKQFLYTVQNDGKIVFNYDDLNLKNLILSMMNFFEEKNVQIIGYTFNEKIEKNSKVKLIKAKKEKEKLVVNGVELKHHLLGEHNAKNISAASILALELGVDIDTIKSVLKNFCGSKRRIDLVFHDNRIKLYDDYAHHHTQIKCTLEAIKEIVDNNEKIIAVLEPHLISRIKNNVQEYNNALLIADYPIVTKVFKSRESFMDDIDVKSLLNNDKVECIDDFDNVVERIKTIISNDKNDKFSVIVMGAGNSYKITEKLKKLFTESKNK